MTGFLPTFYVEKKVNLPPLFFAIEIQKINDQYLLSYDPFLVTN